MDKITLKKPYSRKQYFDFAQYCNQNDYHIENKGFYLEAVKNPEKNYIEKRLAEYPSISDQLDMIYWDKVNNTNIWQDTISEIKAKYPKDEQEA